jgi:RNA polymerase sigma-70 factor (ECF subfamily)
VAERRCKKIFAALSAYLDGNLPVRSCRELERHLKDCPPCLAYLETLKSTVKACQSYSVTKVPPPSPRVRAALLEAMRKSRKR